jgi:signal transduction histidine kinase/ActR/RegA family two-component response regulator
MADQETSIRRKLMTMMMLTCAASIGILATTFIFYELLTTRNVARETASTLARVVASSSTASLAFHDEDDANEVLATLRNEPFILAAALYDDKGNIFATYPRDLDRSILPPSAPADGLKFEGMALEGFQVVSETGDRILGRLFLRVDMVPIYARFGLYGAIAVVLTLIALLVAYILCIVFQRRLSDPIMSLASTANAVSERGDFSVRAPSTRIRELQALTTAFNHMLERIEEQNSRLRENETRMRAQLARLDLLRRTTRAIAERQDLQSIYQVILRSLETDLPIDFGCICEHDPQTRTVTIRNVAGRKADDVGLQMQDSISAEDKTIVRSLSGNIVYEPDIATVQFPLAQTIAGGGVHSLVIAPLSVEDTVFGVLIVGREAIDAFSSADCEFLRQLSEHVALAGHQVQLNSALQTAYDELHQSQQVILQQERLRALGQMASGVAHDINNAISPIALYTETLLDHEPSLSDNAREYLRIIQRSIDDVAQTVAKMREFYRRRDGSTDLQPILLNPLVEQVLKSSRARWADIPQERGIVIEARADLDPQLPRIMGSEADIRDALTNLVFNAVDAMPDGGTLTVRTRQRETANGPCVDLEVEDTGVGMDEATQRRCLEPFFTTKGERGTGMGLAMVYGMARRHNASLEVESAPNVGTTIRLRFRATPSTVVEQVIVPPPVATGALRMLIVDDDPLVLEAVAHVLAKDGHSAESAEGGAAGIDRFIAAYQEGRPFDVVMTDLGMPFVDGRAVAAAVKKLSPQTPVLLLTGWGERLQTEQAIPANIDRVLSKPPKITELRRALAQLVPPNPDDSSARDQMELNP